MSYKGLIPSNIHLLDVIYNKCNTYQHKWEEKSKSYKYFFSNLGLFLLNTQTHIYYSECLRTLIFPLASTDEAYSVSHEVARTQQLHSS